MRNKDQILLESIYSNMRQNGLAQNMDLSDIAKKHNVDPQVLEKELALGIEVEKEHTTSEEEAKKIAMDHLVENPSYYTKLKKVGL
jgi:hypothetical protein